MFNLSTVSNEALIRNLVASYNRMKQDPDFKEAKEAYFNEFLHRLSRAQSKQQEGELLQYFSPEEKHNGIFKDVTETYQRINDELIKTIATLIPIVANDYQNGLNELDNHLIYGNRVLHCSLSTIMPDANQFKTAINNRELYINEDKLIQAVKGTNLERTCKQGICLSTMSSILDLEADTWQELKMLAQDAITSLSLLKFSDKSTYLSLMTQEKSPIFREFKDIINSICMELGLDPVFEQSKVQIFKTTLNHLKTELALDESYQKPSLSPMH